MTMLDDDRLASLLGAAGEAFEVPTAGPADILARARVPADTTGGDVMDMAASDDGAEPDDESKDDRAEAVAGSPRRARRLVAVARRHRALSAAACIAVLLGAAAAGAVLSTPTARSPLTTALAPPTRHEPPPSASAGATTTTPEFSASGINAGAGTASRNTAAGPSPDSLQRAKNSGAAPTASAIPKGSVGQSSKIEQTGTLSLTVARGRLSRTVSQLSGLAATYGGFVANSQTQSGAGATNTPGATVTLEVPVSDFSTVLAQAQRLGKTTGLNTQATDVTGQYVDLQSRIAALQASRQQYLTIMTKASTVGDVLAVQAQLDTIESQIEQLQGQLQVLTSETSYSKMTVNVSEGTPPARPTPLPESGMIHAWHESIGGFLTGVEGFVSVAGPLLFALLCLGLALVGSRVAWRRYQRHRL
jgi:Domain of unknown function (DUF4349)